MGSERIAQYAPHKLEIDFSDASWSNNLADSHIAEIKGKLEILEGKAQIEPPNIH